ncbi:MAG: nicotinate-nucleotide adenylyltransferase [Maricaulaceae bacterium]
MLDLPARLTTSRLADVTGPAARLRLPKGLGPVRIGVFGGSFNPPHEGHLHVARTALRRLNLDQVWWLVSPQNPLKNPSQTSDLAERLAKTAQLATAPAMRVSALEAGLGVQYTSDTLAALKRHLPHVRFVWIMGADNLAGFHRWRGWRDIFATTPIAVVARPPLEAALKARLGPAARIYAHHRVEESAAAGLAALDPPAWVYLTAPMNAASSTALRVDRVTARQQAPE